MGCASSRVTATADCKRLSCLSNCCIDNSTSYQYCERCGSKVNLTDLAKLTKPPYSAVSNGNIIDESKEKIELSKYPLRKRKSK